MSLFSKKMANLTRTACKTLHVSPRLSQHNKFQMLPRTFAKHADSLSGVSCFRHMWTMCQKTTAIAPASLMNKSCIKCCLHTEGDKELVEFLQKEIQLEESTPKFKTSLPDIKDFKVTTDGCNVIFTKLEKDEKLVVKFNINHSVDADEPMKMDEKPDTDEVAHFVSKPPFSVELTKGGNQTVCFSCVFPSEEDYLDEANPQEGKTEESFNDQYEIEEVILHEGDMNEKVFSLGADTMDGMLYDLLMDMLDERGINDEFIEALIDYSTTYEHKEYVKFLSNLKSFVAK